MLDLVAAAVIAASSAHPGSTYGSTTCPQSTAIHQIDSVTEWRYVSTAQHRELNVPCKSKLIIGTDSSIVFTPRGRVAATS